jgi:hypothetical protein
LFCLLCSENLGISEKQIKLAILDASAPRKTLEIAVKRTQMDSFISRRTTKNNAFASAKRKREKTLD